MSHTSPSQGFLFHSVTYEALCHGWWVRPNRSNAGDGAHCPRSPTQQDPKAMPRGIPESQRFCTEGYNKAKGNAGDGDMKSRSQLMTRSLQLLPKPMATFRVKLKESGFFERKKKKAKQISKLNLKCFPSTPHKLALQQDQLSSSSRCETSSV